MTGVSHTGPARLKVDVEAGRWTIPPTRSSAVGRGPHRPFFSSIAFNFRPGCFTTIARRGCGPARHPRTRDRLPGADYDSFRHTLITAMAARVPGWASTSEADLDQVLIDSVRGRGGRNWRTTRTSVMSEATLATARKRVSLARHARLVDITCTRATRPAPGWRSRCATASRLSFFTDQRVVFAGSDSARHGIGALLSRELRLRSGAAALERA